MKRLLLLAFFVLIVSTAAYEECREKKVACTNRPTMPQDGSKQSCGGKSGGGGGGNPPPQATPTPIWKSLIGHYSHRQAGSATCNSMHPNIVDPITVVARLHWHPFLPDWPGGGSEEVHWESPYNHLQHHGLTHSHARGQYFRESGGCWEGEISLADYGGPFDWEGLHTRGHRQEWAHDPYHPLRDGEFFGATVTALTPHYDEVTLDPDCDLYGLPVGHYVEDDYDPSPSHEYSGFSRARDDLAVAFVNSGHHRFVGVEFWDNRQPLMQCNGEDEPRSDGHVFHLGLCEVGYPC